MKQLKEVKDHKGNTFRCTQDMCEQYGVLPNTYRRRLSRGATLEEALTPVKQKPQKKIRKIRRNPYNK